MKRRSMPVGLVVSVKAIFQVMEVIMTQRTEVTELMHSYAQYKAHEICKGRREQLIMTTAMEIYR